jgi:hypothetical protein
MGITFMTVSCVESRFLGDLSLKKAKPSFGASMAPLRYRGGGIALHTRENTKTGFYCPFAKAVPHNSLWEHPRLARSCHQQYRSLFTVELTNKSFKQNYYAKNILFEGFPGWRVRRQHATLVTR